MSARASSSPNPWPNSTRKASRPLAYAWPAFCQFFVSMKTLPSMTRGAQMVARVGFARVHGEGSLEVGDRLLEVGRPLSAGAVGVGEAQNVLDRRPALRHGLARPDREGRLRGRDGLLQVVRRVAARAAPVGEAQKVLGRRPVLREGLAGQDRQGRLEGGDGVIDVVGPLPVHAPQKDAAESALRLRPLQRVGLARPHGEGRIEVSNGHAPGCRPGRRECDFA